MEDFDYRPFKIFVGLFLYFLIILITWPFEEDSK